MRTFKLLGLFLLLQLSLSLFAITITVKQDGTGDFMLIQSAIFASDNGDTVIVWPGTYYENLNFYGKGITLASLNLITNDPSYIQQTIIDGNNSGPCIIVESGESVTIYGFKITHGSGIFNEIMNSTYAGGVYIDQSQSNIINCFITQNSASSAGGIALIKSEVFLSGVTISYNMAELKGGGISIATDSSDMNVVFDTLNRCNIYLNFSGEGSDIYKNYSSQALYLALDTFTVSNPDNFHIFEADQHGYPIQKMIMDIRNAKITTVYSDLYVSPGGSNEDSGLSPDEPLKNIYFALAKIGSDPDSIHTIHLGKGLYSPTTTQENFPVNLRSYIDIQGESRDSTILDADSMTYLLHSSRLDHYYIVSNLTLQDGKGNDFDGSTGGIRLTVSNNVKFKNILIQKCSHNSGSAYNNGSSFNVTFENVEVKECKRGYCALRIGYTPSYLPVPDPDTVYLTNCKVHQCGPGDDPDSGPGGGIHIIGGLHDTPTFYMIMIGCEVTDNLAMYPSPYFVNSGVLLATNVISYIINCTIGNNTALFNPNNCSLGVQEFSKAVVINSILYGNFPRQAGVFGYENTPSELYIKYSLLQGGKDSIFNTNTTNVIYYDPVTNLNMNPLWDTTSMYPYSLSEGSPCIDAGTLDLPLGITLPEYDIAGNPRVWGESVDMGAYEYGPWVSIKENPNSTFNIQHSILLEVSPNPFQYGTYISYELKENGRVNISVYSISGMKVKTLVNTTGSVGDKGNFYWDGRDQNGQALPAGAYILRMTVDEKVVEVVKVVRKLS